MEHPIACPVVRICWWPDTVVFPAAEVDSCALDFNFVWVFDIGISDFLFGCGRGPR